MGLGLLRWGVWPGTIRLNRHAGLVPASTVPHTHRPLVTWPGGPRDEPGVTQVKAKL